MKTETLEPAANVTAAAASLDDITKPATSAVHLQNILLPLDFSEMSLKSLRYAGAFAKKFGAKLTLLHVLQPALCPCDFPYPGPGGEDGFEAVKELLQKLRSTEIPREVQVETIVRQSFVFNGIIDVAGEIHADLIIVTTRGETGIKHLLLGSTAESIVRLAPCPVLVVR